jgi:hypothetical protein
MSVRFVCRSFPGFVRHLSHLIINFPVVSILNDLLTYEMT